MKIEGVVNVRQLRRRDLHAAGLILGRAMRDNPVIVQAFGIPDPESRGRALERFFRPVLLSLLCRGIIIGAFHENDLVGLCGAAHPGSCQLTMVQKLRMLPAVLIGNRFCAALRVLKWVNEWAHRDPSEPHWHVGPVAVEPRVQHQSVGSTLLTAFCRYIDAYGAMAYLETDRSENVDFYQKFGFAVIAEASVLGVTNWFMSRPSSLRSSQPAHGCLSGSARR